MKQLMIYSRLDGSDACWLEITREGGAVSEVHSGLPSLIAGNARQRCVWVVRSEDLGLHSTEIALRRSSDLKRALPFALEEELSVDVESQVFGFFRCESSVSVVVAEALALEAGKRKLHSAGLRPVRIIPDVLLLPREEDRWSAYTYQERALVRLGLDTGFVCETYNLEWSLRQGLADKTEDQYPRSIKLFGENLPDLGLSDVVAQAQPNAEPLMILLAKGLKSYVGPELPSGDSNVIGDARSQRRWFAAAAMLFLSVAMMSGTVWWEGRQFAQANRALDAHIAQVFAQRFPGKRIQDPRLQMQIELDQLRDERTGSNSFLTLMSGLAKALMGESMLKVKHVAFLQGRLSVDLHGTEVSQLERIRNSLQRDGQAGVELTAVQASPGRVSARLLLGSGGDT